MVLLGFDILPALVICSADNVTCPVQGLPILFTSLGRICVIAYTGNEDANKFFHGAKMSLYRIKIIVEIC